MRILLSIREMCEKVAEATERAHETVTTRKTAQVRRYGAACIVVGVNMMRTCVISLGVGRHRCGKLASGFRKINNRH